MAKRGRQPKYKPEYAEMAGIICAETGAIDKNLAKIFEVTERCIRKWKVEHPEFKEAVQKGKDEWDVIDVEYSMLKRAKGFEYEEKYYEKSQKTGKMIMVKKVVKYCPPDTGAGAFILKCREPKRWNDRQIIEANISGTIPINIVKFSDAEANNDTK